MSNEERTREIAPDPELGAVLRLAEGDAPLEEVDWERLRGSIRARAELPLARRRRKGAARLWRPVLPLAAAASVALAVWIGSGETSPEAAPAEQLSAEEVFHPELSEQEFRLLVTGRFDPESLLLLAVDEG